MKEKSMLLSIVLLFAVVSYYSSAVIAEQKGKYDILLGEWEVEADASGQIYVFTFTFSMKENKITGVFTSETLGKAELKEIELKEDKVSFAFSIDVGGGQMAEFATLASIKKDEMEGDLESVAVGGASFTAKKATKK